MNFDLKKESENFEKLVSMSWYVRGYEEKNRISEIQRIRGTIMV